MKKTILAVLLVLSVPAGAERKPLALIHEFGPSPAGKELLSEINSTTFAPRLFGFAWETTLTEAETLGFRCTRSNPTPHVYCDHSEFSLLPDSAKTSIMRNLRLYFARQTGACANRLSRISYIEISPRNDDEGWFSPEKFKAVTERYNKIIAALQSKYDEYRLAEKRLTGSVFADYVWGHQWGRKIEVMTVQIEDNYHLSVTYRAQCAVDEWLAGEQVEQKVDNTAMKNLEINL